MATFEDASRWVRVQFFLTILGFGLFTGALAMDQSHLGDLRVSFAVLSFFFYLLTLTLSFAWTFVDEGRNNKGVYVSFIIFAFLAAIFTIAKVSLYLNVEGNVFHPCLLFYSAAIVFVLLAAIFTIIEVASDVKVKLPTLPSPRKAKKEKKDKDIEAGEEEGEKKEEVVELEDKPKEDEKEEGETKESEEKTEEGATNGHVVKEEEEKKEEEKKEEKEEGEDKKEESAAKE